MRLRRVIEALPRYSYSFSNESELQHCLANALELEGVPFVREHVAGPADRFDFLIEPGIVIEVKCKGSMSQALSQCGRYLKRDDVQAVVLAAARSWAGQQPALATVSGKPLHVVKLRGRAF